MCPFVWPEVERAGDGEPLIPEKGHNAGPDILTGIGRPGYIPSDSSTDVLGLFLVYQVIADKRTRAEIHVLADDSYKDANPGGCDERMPLHRSF